MLINIMQAVLLAVLLMFPFKSDISNYVQSYQMKNACAVADSAIVKDYIHNSTLPEELDSQFLEKLGLEAYAAEDMSYEKLEERKFSLSYEDPASKEIRYSIHSNVLLPQNMDLNFGEVKEKYYPIQVEESDHQTVTVKVTYPDGSIITLHEGHKFEVPANSYFEVTVVPDEGWNAGIPNVTDGSVIKDLVINVSAAQVKNYTLTVENCVNQKVIIRVEDIHNGKTFEMNQNQSVRVGYETKFNLVKIVPNSGYNAGSISPISGVIKGDTIIKVTSAKPSKPPYTEKSWTKPGRYTFIVPDGVNRVKVAVCGGGGGGIYPTGSGATNGGDSSFDTIVATGGKCGSYESYKHHRRMHIGCHNDYRLLASTGGSPNGVSNSNNGYELNFTMKRASNGYGAGGNSVAVGCRMSGSWLENGVGGGSGGYVISEVSVIPNRTYDVVVGAGGVHSSTGGVTPLNGNSGFVLIAYGGDI